MYRYMWMNKCRFPGKTNKYRNSYAYLLWNVNNNKVKNNVRSIWNAEYFVPYIDNEIYLVLKYKQFIMNGFYERQLWFLNKFKL